VVSFEPLRKLIEDRKISTYFLRTKCGIYNLDSKTIQRLMNDESVSANTLDALCQIFSCQVTDIIEILPDPTKENNA